MRWTEEQYDAYILSLKLSAPNPSTISGKDAVDTGPEIQLSKSEDKKSKVYEITPVPKPRQTQRDKWLNPPRPAVARYRAFRDIIRLSKFDLPASNASIRFVLPMPKAWSKKKKKKMYWKPHEQRPDLSNLLKALEDAVYQEDSHIWNYARIEKIWGDTGQIWIK